MGLFDNRSIMVTRLVVAAVLLSLFGIFVAMTVVATEGILPTKAESKSSYTISGDMAWMLMCTALVLLMTPAIAFFYGGMINSQSVVATIATAVLPMAIVPIIWSLLGFSLAFGEDVGGVFGSPATYGLMYNVGASRWNDLTISTSVWFLYQCMFAIITPAIIVGAICDRVNFPALCVFIPLWHIIVYCPITHMVWTPKGIIAAWGVLDFAGGMVVHMSAGYAALAAAFFLGPSKVKTELPANVPYVVLGTALLWFGWFGFVGGSALGATVYTSHAILNTNIATGVAMLTWMLLEQVNGHTFKATGMCLGVVVGLVAITPAAGFVNVGAAAIIGMIGAAVSALTQLLMSAYMTNVADDTLDVFACHGMGGTTGMLLTSLFQSEDAGAHIDGAFYGKPIELGKCLAVMCALIIWYLLATYVLCWFTNLFISFRASEEHELQGLDHSRHHEAPHINPFVRAYSKLHGKAATPRKVPAADLIAAGVIEDSRTDV